MARIMICEACRARWPGHSTCPNCGAPLLELAPPARPPLDPADAPGRPGGQRHLITHLPHMRDLARQFDLGRQEREETPRSPDDEPDP